MTGKRVQAQRACFESGPDSFMPTLQSPLLLNQSYDSDALGSALLGLALQETCSQPKNLTGLLTAYLEPKRAVVAAAMHLLS